MTSGEKAKGCLVLTGGLAVAQGLSAQAIDGATLDQLEPLIVSALAA